MIAAAWDLCGAAERAVGLDAQGVDPLVALQNAGSLDVRDELGRPVSARLIEAQLKAAQVKIAAQGAFASSLPRAAKALGPMESWEAFKAALRASYPRLPWRELWALPLTRLSRQASAPGLVLFLAILIFSAWSFSSRSFRSNLGAGAPLILRC
ncbi:MAG TPA: hypothetical protein DEB40_13960 [Elusimicrobia bacterium]|nr:hypothetical protein [Elusimicrobiota bacterium]